MISRGNYFGGANFFSYYFGRPAGGRAEAGEGRRKGMIENALWVIVGLGLVLVVGGIIFQKMGGKK